MKNKEEETKPDAKHLLTTVFLSPYLAHNLKVEILDYKNDYVGKKYDEIVGLHQWDKHGKYWSALTVGGSKPNIERIKPLLRPLDLIKEITINDEKIRPIEVLENMCGFNTTLLHLRLEKTIGDFTMPIDIYNKLFEYHFDVFGLIEKGLAISIYDVE